MAYRSTHTGEEIDLAVNQVAQKQDQLVSGTNIKTINNASILGSGNLNLATSLSDLGITATAAELNTLDGITASTAELNFVDGVTSNIQTQLNGKQATLTFNTAYNASTNKAATMADISSAIGEIEEALAAI